MPGWTCATDDLHVRDLGSRNGTWVFIDRPERLNDGDLILVGAQLLRFRRLGYPAPHPPEADSTRRMGSSIPTADVAVIEQLRGDGSVRDVFHLSPGRSVTIGREIGDWVFPYDSTMSRRHADIRSEGSEFFVHDASSRNGVAVGVRGDRVLNTGQRLLDRQSDPAAGERVSALKDLSAVRSRISSQRALLRNRRNRLARPSPSADLVGVDHRRPLSHDEEARRGRDGAGVPRRAREDGPQERAQGDAPRHGEGRRRDQPVQSRGGKRQPNLSRERRGGLRLR